MTHAQFIAADPAHSVWLAAHAGTGKTKVLVDRVLRLLIAGEEPSAILCLTYTNAAAQEMQLRLRSVLSRWVMQDADDLLVTLRELLGRDADAAEEALARNLLCGLMDDAYGVQMQTIHGFCQSLLARFPVEADVSSHFTLMDERTAQEALQEARMRLYQQAATQPRSALSAALRSMAAQMSDQRFADVMEAVVRHHTRFAPWFADDDGLVHYRQALAEGLGITQADITAEQAIATLLPLHADMERELRDAIALLSAGGKTMVGLAGILLQWLESARDEAAFNDYCKGFITEKGDARKARSFYTEAFAKSHPHYAELLDFEQTRVMHAQQLLLSLRLFDFNQQLAVIIEQLLVLYSDMKTAQGMIDYDDVIRYAYRLLQKPDMGGWVMEKLDQRIQHIMLDEAQDTSPLQWRLLQMLLEELFRTDVYYERARTLFVVGDRKQSIYRFQGADPAGFDANRVRYQQQMEADAQALVLPVLDQSFRSVEAVLRVVDATFAEDAVRKGVSVVPFGHAVHRAGQGGRVELWPLIVTTKAAIPAPWDVGKPLYNPQDGENTLAENLSQQIAKWLSQGRELCSQGRAVEAGDIMVLVRRRSALVRLLASKLKQLGVAVAGSDRIKLGAHIAVKDILAIADFCLLPADDLTLATVLKTPWFAWDEEALFALAYGRGESSCWERLHAQPEYAVTLAQLAQIREAGLRMAPHEWLVLLLDQLQGRRLCKARLGNEVDELFDELLNQALVFEANHVPSLQAFVHWLRVGDEDIKRDMPHSLNAVRIMTVHGAKGLQAPIVILPDTTGFPPKQDIFWWQAAGEREVGYAVPTGMMVPAQIAQLKSEQAEQVLQEYRRQLYVAMTRAEDELYVCGTINKEEPADGSWYDLVRGGLASLPQCERVEDADGVTMRLVCEQTVPPKAGRYYLPSLSGVTVPNWVLSAPAVEPRAPVLLRPSDMLAGADDAVTYESGDGAEIARLRGVLIHQLLQWAPSAGANLRYEMLQQMAAHFAPPAARLPLEAIVEESWRILQDASLAHCFDAHGMSEISVCGSLFGRPVSGQIDRLIVRDGAVIIVDYKTDRLVPESALVAPEKYIRQLAIYRALLQSVYPQQRVSCALLWTANGCWMPVADEQLDRVLLALQA